MLNYVQFLPDILSNYPLNIVQHEHLRTSENVVVKLISETGQPYALRIRKIIGTYQEQIMSELVILRDFAEFAHADVPAPLLTRAGELFCIVRVGDETYMCIIFYWVPGVHVAGHDITFQQMGFMAYSVAQLHSFALQYKSPAGLVRPVYDENWFFGTKSWTTTPDFVSRFNPDDAVYLRSVNDTIRSYLRTYPRNPSTFGLIHYDLHVGNFLFHESGANMIDFDECGFGYYLFDLAHILFEFIEHPQFDVFKNTAVEQYAAATTTARFSDRDLAMFLALQGIAYANWLYRIFWRDGNVEAMNYWVPIIVKRLKTILR
jgi:Ser/Thr protein kinase RdoA (MazF antagonist)